MYCSCSKSIDERLEKIDQEVDLLRINFADLNNRFFWLVQDVANKMIKDGDLEGYVMKKISGLFTDILVTNYTISLKTLEASREVLKKYFNESTKSATIDDAELLENRISFRSHISAFHYNTQKWKLLHKLIYHYVIKSGPFSEQSPLLREIAYLAYLLREDLVSEVAEIEEAIQRDLEKRKGLANNDKQSIIEKLDRMIDEVLNIGPGSESGQFQFKNKTIKAKLLLATIKDVERLREENVDQKLLEKIRQSEAITREHVISYLPEEVDKVTETDIKNGRILLPSFGNRQKVYNQY